MRKKNLDPITVEVHDGRYDCYGPLTKRSVYLTNMLKGMGGINESVEDGLYHFNVIRVGLKLNVSLVPLIK